MTLIFLFVCLIVALVVLSRLNIDFKNNKIMLIGAVLTVSIIMLQIGNSIGLAVMAIISMLLFFYFLYKG